MQSGRLLQFKYCHAIEAAAADVKAILDISQEGLNRTWDRADAIYHRLKAPLRRKNLS